MAHVKGTLGRAHEVVKLDPFAIEIEDGYNIRTDYGDIPGFAAALAENGIVNLTPIVVQRTDEGALVVRAGHRRLEAVKYAIRELEAELKYIPAVIRTKKLSRAHATLETILENDGKPLEPHELAVGYQRLLDWGWSQAEIAARVGKSQSHVSRTLGLAPASAELKQALSNGDITQGEARQIIKDAADADQPSTLAPGASTTLQPDVAPNGENVKSIPLPAPKDAAQLQGEKLKEIKGKPKPQRTKQAKAAKYLKLLVQELANSFGTYEGYNESRWFQDYTEHEMQAYYSGRLSILCELCGDGKDLADLEALLQQAKGEA